MPEDGGSIMAAKGLNLEKDGDLLRIKVINEDESVSEMCVSLRSDMEN